MKYLSLKSLENTKDLISKCKNTDDIILVGDSMDDMKLVVMDIDYFAKHFYVSYINQTIKEAEKQLEEGKCVTWADVKSRIKKEIE